MESGRLVCIIEEPPLTEPLIQSQTEIGKLAQELREMAERMEKNGAEYFGGCFVVIPPQGNDPVKTLILDKSQDVAQFWGTLKTKVDMALSGIEEQLRATRGYR